MIKYLEGKREQCDYEEMKGLLLYDNVEEESYPNHWHASIEIIMPIENGYHVECGVESYDLREGDVLIILPGTLHCLEGRRGRRLIFQAYINMLNELCSLETLYAMGAPAVLITPEKNPKVHRDICRKLEESSEIYFSKQQLRELAITSNLLQILCMVGDTLIGEKRSVTETISTQKSEQYYRIMDIQQYINLHCAEDLSLEQVAARAGFSMYHFERIFKEHIGLSFYKYLNYCRIRRAEWLMSDPKVSITEAATRSGFKSSSSFIRMFKIVNGCTPSEFRKMKG
ncbi:MAG: AraC family transcriptional regulator [Lachnospiraceae bacterium]|nr:AraC family transcriptional regulator [Lachnospiraceae bacterium]